VTRYEVTYSDGTYREGQEPLYAASDDDALREALEGVADWIRDGDWGVDGACVVGRVWLTRQSAPECAYCSLPAVGPDQDGRPACVEHEPHPGPTRSGDRNDR
jgi:hypothetical protein